MTIDPEAKLQLIGFYNHLKLTEDQMQDPITKDLLSYNSISVISVVPFTIFS